MIYNRLNIFYNTVLLISVVLLCFSSCRRGNHPDNDGEEARTTIVQPLSSRMSEFEPDELSFEAVLQPLDSSAFYLGEIRSADTSDAFSMSFLFSVNTILAKSFDVTLYDITDTMTSTISPESLAGAIKSRKFVVNFRGEKLQVRKVMLAQTTSGIKGSFTIRKRLFEFSLNRMEQPEYKEFESRYVHATHPVRIIRNVKYGEAMGYWTSNVTDGENYLEIFAKGVSSTAKKRPLNLLMDIYLPEDDDVESRPLIVFIHGGAFYVGDKADNPIVLWCKHFASSGYVVASINYRMGFQLSKTSIERCAYAALQDAHAALRFLLSKKEDYRINPDYIFAAGSSAGAITALNLSFMRNTTRPATSRKNGSHLDMGDIESSGNTLEQDFTVRAVANMWGALSDLKLLTSAQTAVVSFHGNADRLVPYDSGIPFSDLKVKIGPLFFNKMYGSAAIHRKAQQLGLRNKLYTFRGVGHAPHVDQRNRPTAEFYFIQEHITDFFLEEFIPSNTELRRDENAPQRFCLNASGLKEVCWKVEGGFILQSDSTCARAVFVEGVPHSLRVSALWKNGASGVFSADM